MSAAVFADRPMPRCQWHWQYAIILKGCDTCRQHVPYSHQEQRQSLMPPTGSSLLQAVCEGPQIQYPSQPTAPGFRCIVEYSICLHTSLRRIAEKYGNLVQVHCLKTSRHCLTVA